MTTDNSTPATAGSEQPLSAWEVAALNVFADGGHVSWGMQEQLIAKGVLAAVDIADNGLTPLGREFLWGHKPLAASQQTAVRPETITAKGFVEQGYAEKVKRGECFVLRNTPEGAKEVVTARELEDGSIETVMNFAGLTEFYRIASGEEFRVCWLPATEQPAPESGKRNLLRPKDIDALWEFFRAVEDVMDNYARDERLTELNKALDIVRTELES